MYKLVIKVHKLFFCSHVIKVHLRTSRGGGGAGNLAEPTHANVYMVGNSHLLNHSADKNKGYKK